MPADTPDYMDGAWLSALYYAIGQPDILKRFSADTNMHWRPGTTPLDRMIDEVTGAELKFLEAFIPWFNANVWGAMDD